MTFFFNFFKDTQPEHLIESQTRRSFCLPCLAQRKKKERQGCTLHNCVHNNYEPCGLIIWICRYLSRVPHIHRLIIHRRHGAFFPNASIFSLSSLALPLCVGRFSVHAIILSISFFSFSSFSLFWVEERKRKKKRKKKTGL